MMVPTAAIPIAATETRLTRSEPVRELPRAHDIEVEVKPRGASPSSPPVGH
jgi:hypothetical protein